MRSPLALALPLLLVGLPAEAQSCTGLCLQQVSCTGGGTTTITGKVYAPNGTDPLPGVLVYIPNAAVATFSPGVSCTPAGQLPSGSPLVGSTTAVDGSFQLGNVPVGTNIPLVVQSGRWRRQVTVPVTTACTDTAFSTRFPQTQAEGDIPKFAIVTGSADSVECVLRKVGIADSEFTDASGNGRINLYAAAGSPGATIDSATPKEAAVMGSATALNAYDVVMLPCEGGRYNKSSAELTNLVQFANAGGRVYGSHYAYEWMYQNPPFNSVVTWNPDQQDPPDGTATVETSFSQGQTLSEWLTVVGATATPGQIAISTLRHDFNTVVAPTQSWLTLNNATYGNPIQQITFDTPVNAGTNACGRVLFNEYHVENQNGRTATGTFPTECTSGTTMTPQEKLLEFSLFDLTSDGTPPTISPSTVSFGNEPIGSSTGTQELTYTNTTLFPISITSVTATGSFTITQNTCTNVAVGATCVIDVSFSPTGLGALSGTLTVVSNTGTLTATLSGTGLTPLQVSAPTLTFGKLDVGASATQSVTLSNITANALPLALPAVTGDFTSSSTCGATMAANSSCTVSVVFKPSATGARTGTLNFSLGTGSGASVLSTNLSGTGVDFSESVGPASASTVAGLSVTTTSTTSPLAGFSAPVTVTCTTTAPASTCTPANAGFTPAAAVNDAVSITTTSQYTVIGAGVLGGRSGDWLWVLLAGSGGGLLLLRRRRHAAAALTRAALLSLVALALGSGLLGCSGKQPGVNSPYTPAGSYTYTVTVTDGFLVHAATYNLSVSAK